MRNFIILLIFIIVGSVIGGFAAEHLGDIEFLSWMRFGYWVGFYADSPVHLDLIILKLVFGIEFGGNIAQAIFISFGVFFFFLVTKRIKGSKKVAAEEPATAAAHAAAARPGAAPAGGPPRPGVPPAGGPPKPGAPLK